MVTVIIACSKVYEWPFTEISLNGNNLSGENYYDNTVSKNHHNFTKVVIDICNDLMDRDVFEGKLFLKYLKKWAVIPKLNKALYFFYIKFSGWNFVCGFDGTFLLYNKKLWCLFLGPYGKYDADKINRFIKDYMNVKDQHVLVIGKVIATKYYFKQCVHRLLKYGSEEKGSSLCKCSILLGFFMSKKLERLRSELLSEDKITNLLSFLTK